MLEFCQAVKPNLDNYEADGVRFSITFEYLGFHLILTSAGMAHSPG